MSVFEHTLNIDVRYRIVFPETTFEVCLWSYDLMPG